MGRHVIGTVPPSITCSVPVSEDGRSDARNAIRSATSCGLPPAQWYAAKRVHNGHGLPDFIVAGAGFLRDTNGQTFEPGSAMPPGKALTTRTPLGELP